MAVAYTTTVNWNGHSLNSSRGCNESKKFDNDEKALYHGLKSAYRMSRKSDGEYGTDVPPYDTAAQIAAQVAIAYLRVTGAEYCRRESFEYIRDHHIEDFPAAYTEQVVLNGRTEPPVSIDEDALSDVLDHAWTQIDDKRNHDDAARTALAIAEAFLGVRMGVGA